MNTGKEMCEVLKSMRKKIAEQYGLVYEPTECHHEGNCQGTCPRCDAELRDLQRQLEEKGVPLVEFDDMMNKEVEKLYQKQMSELQDQLKDDGETIVATEGMPALEGDIQAPPERIFHYKRALYKNCAVAGISFHDIDDIWEELYVGAEIALVRDKKNKHDKNAVAVVLADDYDGNPDDFDFDYILGYIPRSENEHIAMMLDMGWSDVFECKISELNEHRPYSDRLHIDIYIRSKEEVEDNHCDQLRGFALGEDLYDRIASDLIKKGNTYFRWGGFPPWERNLPIKGDNVVFIHRRDNDCVLYLMHLIATGDDAEPFVEDKEELRMVDDCMHYVFTNVKGPIIMKQEDIAFLDEETIDNVQPEEYLTNLGECIKANGKLLISNLKVCNRVLESGPDNSNFKNLKPQPLMRAIAIAWAYDTIEETEKNEHTFCLYDDKDELYACKYLVKLIFALRNGSPKKRAAQVEFAGTFRSITKYARCKSDSGLLSTLVRAWMAFYDSFDYGSALHKAMKLPGDRHLNAILVGALADAMYGCGMYLVKKKYGESSYLNIEKLVDKDIIEFCSTKRIFYPKNNATTNVERHIWKDIQTPYENREVSEELRGRVLKAFSPDWDNLYGFYLDDGWVYIYRSYVLLNRFRLDKLDDSTWVMRNIQASGEKSELGLTPIEEAMSSVEHRWYLISGEKAPKNLEYCKYYHGEPEMPEQIKGNKPISNFWHGEMMFVTHQLDMDSWKQNAANILEELDGEKRRKFLSYSEEQRAILVYIEAIFGKWCPYDNLE